MRLIPGCELRKARGGWTLLVLEGDRQRALQVNESFALMWQEASRQGEFSVESLAGAILEHFDVDAQEADSCARDLIALWRREGLILL